MSSYGYYLLVPNLYLFYYNIAAKIALFVNKNKQKAKKSSIFKKVGVNWPVFHKKYVPLHRICAPSQGAKGTIDTKTSKNDYEE